MSEDRRLKKARQLIEEKDYLTARMLLIQVNTPAAQELLDELDSLERRAEHPATGIFSKPKIITIILVLILTGVLGISVLFPSSFELPGSSISATRTALSIINSTGLIYISQTEAAITLSIESTEAVTPAAP